MQPFHILFTLFILTSVQCQQQPQIQTTDSLTVEPITVQPIAQQIPVTIISDVDNVRKQDTVVVQQDQAKKQETNEQNIKKQENQNVENNEQNTGNEYQKNVANGQQNNPNFGNEQPNQQFSSQQNTKYRQQQQRIAQLRRKQQQYDERKARESQQRITYDEDSATQMSKQQFVRIQERSDVQKISQQQDQSLPRKTVLFQINRQIQEFTIKPYHQTKIVLKILIYTLENNAYGFVKDIQTSKLLKMFIYEDNKKIIVQSEFYFEKAVMFQAKAGSKYVIRFYNDGLMKLVSFNYPSLVEQTHVDKLLKKQQGQYHLEKVNFIGLRIHQIAQRLRRNSFLDKLNNEAMMNFLRSYSSYEIVEMIIVIVLTIFQVHVLKKLFPTDNIV